MRWKDYFLRRNDDCCAFWKEYLIERKHVLFILGYGFDPRMCVALDSILKCSGQTSLDCTLVDFSGDLEQYATPLQSLMTGNNHKLNKIMDGRGKIDKKHIEMKTDDDRSVGARNVTKLFTRPADFDNYTDIIVDISSLPLNIYFPLLGRILNILDEQKSEKYAAVPNLHITAVENIQIDRCISKRELSDNANYLYGFVGDIDLESEADKPLVWIPMLSEHKKDELERINNRVSPREICPVIPSPSTDPRRGDNIILEYRGLLDDMQVETSNITYGSEQNPFETYRQIHKSIEYYRDVLKPLGGPRFAISPLSSKLASIGAFLVAYEEGLSRKEMVGIAYVESAGYRMSNYKEELLNSSELFSMWISGECYEE